MIHLGDITKINGAEIEPVDCITAAGPNTTQRRRGEWIWSPRDTDGTVSGCCSNCSFSHLFIGGHTAQYNFCPNCGADMKGATDGNK